MGSDTVAEGPKVTTAYASTSVSSSHGDDPKAAVHINIQSDDAAKPRAHNSPSGFITRLKGLAGGWFFEYISIFVSAITLVGLCTLLWHFDGEPAPTWSFGPGNGAAGKANHVSLNSIISLFTTTASFAIAYPLSKALGQLTWVWFKKSERQLTDLNVFDQASKQNPFGSLKLIYKLKGRHFAVIGGVIVICLQLYHFFTQQLIQTRQEYWPDYRNTSFPPQPNFAEAEPYVEKLFNGSLDKIPKLLKVARVANSSNYTNTIPGQPPYYSVETALKGNLWAALYGSDTNSDWSIPSYYCATGDCSFYNYSSIGVCSRCADLGPQVIRSCTPKPSYDLSNSTAGCDIVLPNGFSLGGPERNRTNLMAVSTSYKPLIFTNYTSPFAIVQSILANNTLFVNQSSSVSASECALIPCAITYANATSYNDPDNFQLGYNSVPLYEYASTIYDAYTFNTSAFPWNGPTVDIPQSAAISPATTYKMDQRAFTGLQVYLSNLFNGFVTSDGENTTFAGDNATRAVNTNNADAMQAIFQPVNYCNDVFGIMVVDQVACNMASVGIALTNAMRGQAPTSFDFSTGQATGLTNYPQPTIFVAWMWLVPVTALWLLSVILVVGTVIKTKRAGVRDLGLNPLALIFLGVEEDEEQRANPGDRQWWHSEEEAKRRAETMRVQLALQGRRPSLVQGKLPPVEE